MNGRWIALVGRSPTSWIGRAEFCKGDDDARFIFLWIAFNAAQADEREFQSIPQGERAAFLDFFGRLIEQDAERRIYKAVWQRFSGPVSSLLENRFVFNPFWQQHNGIDGFEDWEDRFKASARSFTLSFQAGDTACVLSFDFLIASMSCGISSSMEARLGTVALTARRFATEQRFWVSFCCYSWTL